MAELFSARLNEAISERGMKGSELCRRAGMSRSALSGYLTASYLPKSDRLSKIAEVLNVSSEWLMGYDVPMEAGTLAGSANISEDAKKKGLSLNADIIEKARLSMRFVPVLNIDDLEKVSVDKISESPELFSGYVPYCIGADDDLRNIICIKLNSENEMINTCMMPYLMPGDIVFADISAKPKRNDIVLANNRIDPGVFCIFSESGKPKFRFPHETPMYEFMHSKSIVMAVVTGVIRKSSPIFSEDNWAVPEISESLAAARSSDGSGELRKAPDESMYSKFEKLSGSKGY